MIPGVREDARSAGSVAPSRRRSSRARAVVTCSVATALLVGIAALLSGGVDSSSWWASSDGQTRFVVLDPETGEELHVREVRVGERLELTHTHSVTRRPVLEVFSVDEERTLTLEELVFDEPGPNLPTGPERFGSTETTFSHEDGVYRVRHHGFPIATVGLRVGREDVDHTLTFEDGSQVRLLELTRAGGPVELTTR